MNHLAHQRMRTRGIRVVTTVTAVVFLTLVGMAAPALAVGQGNPPTVECGLADPLYNKFQINNGEVGTSEVSTPPGEIIDLESNGDGTFDYELTDDDYIITRIVMKHGQTADIVLNAPAASGTLSPADDISHITFCFGTPVEELTPVDVNVEVVPCTGKSQTTPVLVTIPGGNATITIFSGGEEVDSVGSTDTLELPAGDYTWTATPDEEFEIEGADEGSFTVEDCEEVIDLRLARATVSLGACDFADEESSAPASVKISPTGGATVVLSDTEGTVAELGGSGGSVDLNPGTYTYVVDAAPGFDLSGASNGSLTVEDCAPDVLGVIEKREEALARTGSLKLGTLTGIGGTLLALGLIIMWLTTLTSTNVEAAGTATIRSFGSSSLPTFHSGRRLDRTRKRKQRRRERG